MLSLGILLFINRHWLPISSSIFAISIISIPPKIWRPTPKNNYKPMVCTNIDEDLYAFKHYGKTMKRTPSQTSRPRSDVIPWNSSLYQQALDANFNIDFMTDDFTHQAILQIIKDNWDSFYEVRVARPMLDFEFCIDTGNTKSICCRQPKYSVHEAEMMSKQISELANNNQIRDCAGPWGVLLLLLAKPHQKPCTNIDKFAWRMCVSYRSLNS